MLVIERIMYTKFHLHSSYHFDSYTDTCDPIIMYCMALFVVVYSKQCFLQTSKYDQSLRVMISTFLENFISVHC